MEDGGGWVEGGGEGVVLGSAAELQLAVRNTDRYQKPAFAAMHGPHSLVRFGD